jgi:hypothetical protein
MKLQTLFDDGSGAAGKAVSSDVKLDSLQSRRQHAHEKVVLQGNGVFGFGNSQS